MSCIYCQKPAEHFVCKECKDTPTWIEVDGVAMFIVGDQVDGITAAEPTYEQPKTCPTCRQNTHYTPYRYHFITPQQAMKRIIEPQKFREPSDELSV